MSAFPSAVIINTGALDSNLPLLPIGSVLALQVKRAELHNNLAPVALWHLITGALVLKLATIPAFPTTVGKGIVACSLLPIPVFAISLNKGAVAERTDPV